MSDGSRLSSRCFLALPFFAALFADWAAEPADRVELAAAFSAAAADWSGRAANRVMPPPLGE